MQSLEGSPDPIDIKEGWKADPLGSDKLRFWDGSTWTDRVGQAQKVAVPLGAPAPVSLTVKSADERKAALAQRIQYVVNVERGRVESQTDYQAVVVTGKKVNHVLHLILTLVTLGFWVFVWAGLAIFGGEKRWVVSVDEYGQVLR